MIERGVSESVGVIITGYDVGEEEPVSDDDAATRQRGVT